MSIKFVATYDTVTAIYDDGTRRQVPMESGESARVGTDLQMAGLFGLEGVQPLDPSDPEVSEDTVGGAVVDDHDPEVLGSPLGDTLATVADWPLQERAAA